jgi:acetylornithine deacetylase
MDAVAGLVELVQQLIRIDSANPATARNGPGEGEIAAFAERWLSAAGLEVHAELFAPGRPSVVARAPGRGGGCSVMLVGHLDTFGRPEGQASPEALAGVLRGSGAFDMKAGLATLMTVAVDAATAALRGDVLLALVGDEEHQSLGIRSVLRRWRADAAVVGEGTGLSLGMAHEGRIQLAVETDEPPGALPLELRLALAGRSVSGRLSYAADPDSECRAHIRRMLAPGEAADGPLRELQASIGRQFRIVHTDVRPAFLGDPAHPLSSCMTASLRGRRGEARRSTLEGWTEAGVLNAAGLPTVVFGPAGGGAHTDAEWVDLESVATCRAVLRDTVSEYCN